MLLYIKHSGQLCNRLWSIIPAYTYALKNNITLNVLFANKTYLDNFPNVSNCKNIRFWFSDKCMQKQILIDWFVHFSENNQLEIKGELKNHKQSKCKLYFIDGWEHNLDKSYVEEYKDEIVKMFSVKDEIKDKISSILDGYNGVTIGVHVRRGDYKQWRDGRYYYDDDIYGKIMLQLKNQFNQIAVKCRFLVCSNEVFEWSHPELNILQIPETDGVTDLYALSRCNYIFGPPSTYSQWASFVGNVPMSFILDNSIMEINEFSPIVLMNKFENGKYLKSLPDETFIVSF